MSARKLPVPANVSYPVHCGSCPECGHDGPHHVQHDGFQLEFACEGCGMQNEVPASYKRRLRRAS